MCSWQGYIDNLMADGNCQDAAIVGYEQNNKYVWAACPGGSFATITPEEIQALVEKHREHIGVDGLSLGKLKCSLIRDNLDEEQNYTMDVRSKSLSGEPTCNISIAKAGKVLVLVEGKDGVHGGAMNTKAAAMADHLKKNGY